MRRKNKNDEVSVYDLDALRAAFRQSISDNDGEAAGWSAQAERFLKSVALREVSPKRPIASRRRDDQPQLASWNAFAARWQSVLKPLRNTRLAEHDQ